MRGRLLSAAMVTLAVACGRNARTGNASLLVQMLAPADITRIRLEVQPANIVRDLSADQYDEATGAFTATLTVPAGAQTISASAYAATTLVGTASATVTFTAAAGGRKTFNRTRIRSLNFLPAKGVGSLRRIHSSSRRSRVASASR